MSLDRGGSCKRIIQRLPAAEAPQSLELITVEHLEALGIHDRYLRRLQELVAERIGR